MTNAEELDALKAKLAARKKMPGFEENVRELQKRIDELERQSN
ncbi:hypothetical protein [Sphingomonas sp. MA1305]|nr:hypothetical protein [Sphingomonas sp. MA1305]